MILSKMTVLLRAPMGGYELSRKFFIKSESDKLSRFDKVYRKETVEKSRCDFRNFVRRLT